jgi:hypothetical protein
MKFFTWLMHQRWRSDPIGDLARDVERAPFGWKTADTWLKVQDRIRGLELDRLVVQAVRAAWQEYELYVGGPSHLRKDVWVVGLIASSRSPLFKILKEESN